ncbi:MAG TPA: hypothetical protein VLQ91_01995 [Draconibacterium sp.]|nr:hypothetical protein [Draconibacterium sp.]
MKTFRLIFLLAFVNGVFVSFNSIAQVESSKVEDFELTLLIKVNGVINSYNLTGVEIIKITPSGNLSRILTFKVEPENEIMELANPFAFLRVRANGDFNGDGEMETIVDEFAVLTKTGNLKVVYHMKENTK